MNQKNSDFLLNTSRLLLGNTTASLFSFITMPVISRMYSPLNFGHASYFISLVTIAASISCLRYESSIVITSNSKMTQIMVINSTIICLFVSILFWIAASIFNVYHFQFFSPISGFINFLPFLIFFIGLSQIFLSVFQKEKKFSAIAGFNVVRIIGQQLSRVLCGISGFPTTYVLIVTVIIGYIAGVVTLTNQLRSLFSTSLIKWITLKKLFIGLKRYKNFPIYSSWSYLLNILGFQLPFLMIGYFFSMEKVGYYSMSVMLLSFPMTIANAISRVLYQRCTEAKFEGDLKQLMFNSYKRLVAYAALPFMLLAIFGSWVIPFFFGSQWTEAGLFSQLMALLYFVIFFSSPLTCLWNIQEQQKVNSFFVLARIISQTMGMVIGGIMGNIFIILITYVVFGAIVRFLSITWIMSTIGVKRKECFFWLIKSTLLTGIILLLWELSHHYYSTSLVIDIVGLMFIFLTHYFLLIRNDHQFRSVMISLIKRYRFI